MGACVHIVQIYEQNSRPVASYTYSIWVSWVPLVGTEVAGGCCVLDASVSLANNEL